MKILLTGCCGFIGFNFANYLINSNKKVKIVGLDNLNNYYSVDLKKKRLLELKKNKKFSFKKIDINDYNKLAKIYKSNKFDYVFNFAAQANVRYSFINPKAYVESNINGFFNILDLAIKNKIKKVFYASSSSIYGDSKNFPTKEKSILNPKNIYGLSKKINEDMAEILTARSNTQCIGLRFFTIYGEWGRPDMFLFKYLESCFNKKKIFYLNNFGNHLRDFTYIKDVCEILKKLINIKIKKQHVVFNISSNNPIKITKIISDISNLINKKANVKKIELQKLEMYKTHGDNSLIRKVVKKKKFTPINVGLKNTVNWFVENKDKINLY